MREQVLLFGKTNSLVGVLTDPPDAKRYLKPPAVILLNAGIVHRVGPHRLYVKMARALSEIGFVVLRFDFSGIGDSKVRHDNLSFERSAISEAQAAVNYLHQVRGADRFVLIGLCSGAAVSLQTACCDTRIVGAVLMNTEPGQQETSDELRSYIAERKDARHYWRTALLSLESWWKVVAGKADYPKIASTLASQFRSLLTRKKGKWSGMDQVARNFRSLIERGVRLLFVFSPGDPGLCYLDAVAGNELRRWNSSGRIEWQIVRGSNHTFTSLGSQDRLLKLICDWHLKMMQH